MTSFCLAAFTGRPDSFILLPRPFGTVNQMPIQVKRIYCPVDPDDGIRVLVERLWPRGVSKEAARVDLWLREAAPSPRLRKWFRHAPERWNAFRKQYFAELDANPEGLAPLLQLETGSMVTFVFAAREEHFNNAVALREYVLERFESRARNDPA